MATCCSWRCLVPALEAAGSAPVRRTADEHARALSVMGTAGAPRMADLL